MRAREKARQPPTVGGGFANQSPGDLCACVLYSSRRVLAARRRRTQWTREAVYKRDALTRPAELNTQNPFGRHRLD